MNRLLGYLVTLVLLWLALEGLLRAAAAVIPLFNVFLPQPVVVEFNADRGWANRKDVTVHRAMPEFSVDYALNSKGLRGPEVAATKPAGRKRILFIGDSFTLGYTVKDDAGFVRILEKSLREDGHDVEALNAGTEGYSTDQELVYFQTEGKQLQADYVVFAPYLNDVYQNSQDTYTIRKKPRFEIRGDDVALASAPLVAAAPTPWWATKFALGSYIERKMNPRVPATMQRGGSSLWLEDCPLLMDSPPAIEDAWKITAALVQKLGREIVASGAKPVALLVPNKWEIHPESPMPQTLNVSRADIDPAKPTDRFASICEAAGFVVVDPRAALRAEAAKRTRLYFNMDWHWNADGYEVAAGALLDRFLKPDLLGPGTGAVTASALAAHGAHGQSGGIPTWAIVVGALWLVLGTFYWLSYPRENPAIAYAKVAGLIAGVAAVFVGVGKLAGSLPPTVGRFVFPLIVIGLIVFIVVKIGKRFGVITELYGTFLRRGHWYMLPMLIVMLSIGMLLVVAASSPFVAPFIYTLF